MANDVTLHGCLPILCTPFTREGVLDLNGLQLEIEYVLAAGATGVVCNAIASEGYKLTEAERDAVIELTVQAVNGRAPVVAAAEGSGLHPAVDRAQRAARLGANALMALPPSFIKPDAEALMLYYQQIGKESGLPLIVQDAPQLTGVTMTPAFWSDLADVAPEFKYVKIEGSPQGGVISGIKHLCEDRLGVFCGWGGLGMLDGLERGIVGSMPAPNFTRDFSSIQLEWEAGNYETAMDLFNRVLPFVVWSMQSIDYSVATAKEELRRLGIIGSNVMRSPAVALDPVSFGQLNRFIDARIAAATATTATA